MVEGTGKDGRLTKGDVFAHAPKAAAPAIAAETPKPTAPAARSRRRK